MMSPSSMTIFEASSIFGKNPASTSSMPELWMHLRFASTMGLGMSPIMCVANYDSSEVATQFMDVCFCGLIYDFWPSFDQVYRIPCPDMLARFKEGSRHDAMGQRPVVVLDESTGLPRGLSDAEIEADTHQPAQRDSRPRRYKMHKMISIAIRSCIALGFNRSQFNIKAHNKNTVRSAMHILTSRILSSIFGVKAYSYFRGNMPHVPNYIHIDACSTERQGGPYRDAGARTKAWLSATARL